MRRGKRFLAVGKGIGTLTLSDPWSGENVKLKYI